MQSASLLRVCFIVLSCLVASASTAQDYTGRFYGKVSYKGVFGPCLNLMSTAEAIRFESQVLQALVKDGVNLSGAPFALKVKRKNGRYQALFNNHRVRRLSANRSRLFVYLSSKRVKVPVVTDRGTLWHTCSITHDVVLNPPSRSSAYGSYYIGFHNCDSGMPYCAFQFSGRMRRSSAK